MLPTMGGAVFLGMLMRVPVFAEFAAIFMPIFVFMWVPGGIQQQLLALIALVITVLAHEMGHALAARARGQMGITVVISALGGFCTYAGNTAPSAKVMISLAGPATNAILATLAWLVGGWLEMLPAVNEPGSFLGLIAHLLSWIFIWNLFLGIFNILPIYPLDGGQALFSGMQAMGVRMQTARGVTLSAAIVGAVALILLSPQWIGQPGLLTILILGMLVYQAWNDLR